MNPLITISCLCYNHEKYVGQTIESVLCQSFADFELVIIDDGSTDNSLGEIRRFRDRRIKVISQENKGPSSASWRSIAEANGKLVALMSADDLCEPDWLQRHQEIIATEQADVVFCRPSLIDDENESLPDSIWPIFFKRHFDSQHSLFRTLFENGNFLCAIGAMLRKETILKYSWVHCGLLQLQDFHLWVRLAPFQRFKLLDDRLIRYRIRSSQRNLSAKKNKWRSEFETNYIYRHFFDEVPLDWLDKVFPEARLVAENQENLVPIRLAGLLVNHKKLPIRKIGIETLISLATKPRELELVEQTLGLRWPEILKRGAEEKKSKLLPFL